MNSPDATYRRIHGGTSAAPPESMTMDRLGDLDELVVAQTTQMLCRQGCCRPSVNWVLLDSSNYDANSSANNNNPFDLPIAGGWIHEEATFFQRCLCDAPGCRETRFVHHSGPPPISLGRDDYHYFCTVQREPSSSFLTREELTSDIVAIHEKNNTCMTGCCCPPSYQPYLRTLDHQGRYLGETKYVCDECLFVPKFLVLDKLRQPRFLLRPDTCWGGLCMRPRCGGKRGKCCRLPFLVRDPYTREALPAGHNMRDGEDWAQVTQLWSGLANEVCFKRHAYHVAFPSRMHSTEHSSQYCSKEDKLVLIGSSILIDVALFEKDDDAN